MQPILKSKLEFYNSPACNQITQSLDNVRVAREVAQENLENLLERGQKLEILVDSSKSLNEESLMFKKNTKKIEKKMWWHN
jgi:vesicle-associated membrane protein 7